MIRSQFTCNVLLILTQVRYITAAAEVLAVILEVVVCVMVFLFVKYVNNKKHISTSSLEGRKCFI